MALKSIFAAGMIKNLTDKIRTRKIEGKNNSWLLFPLGVLVGVALTLGVQKTVKRKVGKEVKKLEKERLKKIA